eukprot:gb/GFBE01013002.1/.p1 GENE.gb/GFBE01013002.1/~~gb/GFBE01013002.1/.p1  ORF type:complete len:246 (+),score=42.25 gb/GFBE01013002.1/:1-738(+)
MSVQPVELEKGLDEDVAMRSEVWDQISLDSTATGTPLSIECQRWELTSSGSGSSSIDSEVSRQVSPLERADLQDQLRQQDPTSQVLKIRQPQGAVRAHGWRRRKYTDACSQRCSPADTSDASPLETSEVLICGPLQQRFWGFAWRWRWCVLTQQKLYIYRDEACWLESPGDPFETHEVNDLLAVNECSFSGPPDFRCLDSVDGSGIATFRGGDSELWEEIAAMHLWVDFINFAARTARAPETHLP